MGYDLPQYFFVDFGADEWLGGSNIHFVERTGEYQCRTPCGLTPNPGTCTTVRIPPSDIDADNLREEVCYNCRRTALFEEKGAALILKGHDQDE